MTCQVGDACEMLTRETEWAAESVLKPPCPVRFSQFTIAHEAWDQGEQVGGLETVFIAQGVSIFPPIKQ